MALDDSASLEYPLVRRLDPNSREVVIRHHVGGNTAPGAGDGGNWSLHADSAIALRA
jgi:hypothetical protein